MEKNELYFHLSIYNLNFPSSLYFTNILLFFQVALYYNRAFIQHLSLLTLPFSFFAGTDAQKTKIIAPSVLSTAKR